ncbi:integrator complex subunit 11 [Dendrobium catenatum]|uniref:Integrator complex subunit 11 n=1 Tax=Dendrobium catenatum TaxID=906689 RepID=A0A2I0X9H8_9ASPA|nr:integrator complex subunit 11 [Dendrobium catenatum]
MVLLKKSWMKKDYGSANEVIQRKIRRSLKNLFYWSKNKLKELNDRNQLLKMEISMLQNKEAKEGGLNHGDLLLLRSMVTEFKTNLARIATWWKQRSKCQWMEEGEKNTSYYNTYASAKKKSNRILQIAKEDGSLVSNQEEIHGIMESFFKQKWKKRQCDLNNWPIFKYSECIQDNMKKILEADFTLDELKFTLNKMGNNKSPGVMGLMPISSKIIGTLWRRKLGML